MMMIIKGEVIPIGKEITVMEILETLEMVGINELL